LKSVRIFCYTLIFYLLQTAYDVVSGPITLRQGDVLVSTSFLI